MTGPRAPAAMKITSMVPENHGSPRPNPGRRRPSSPGAATASSVARGVETISSAARQGPARLTPDPGVQHPVGKVDQEVQDDEDAGVDQHDSLDHRVVAGGYGLDHQLAEAWPREEILDDDRR